LIIVLTIIAIILFYQLVHKFVDIRKYKKTIKSYDKAIEINPDDADAWYTKQVGAALLDFPCFGFAHRRYEGELQTMLKDRMKMFDHIDSISIEAKSCIRPWVVNAIGQVIPFEAWRELISKYYSYILSFLLVFSMCIPYLWLSNFVSSRINQTCLESTSPLWVGGIAIVVVAIGFLVVNILSKWGNRTFEAMVLLCTFTLLALFEWGLAWFSQVVVYGIIVGLVFMTTLLWVIFVFYHVYRAVDKLILRTCYRRCPEASIVDSLILALAIAEEEPKRRRDEEIMNRLLLQLEYIAQMLENELHRKCYSRDTSTDVWLHKRGREMATGIRQLKQCVLLPREGSQERLATMLGERLVNAANGDWDMFNRIEVPTTPTRRSRIVHILRKLVATTFPLLILLIIVNSPLELSNTVMGYIVAACIGWVTINILTWLDPDYHEKMETFADRSDILPRRRTK
jgi:hypothetical protein